MPSSSSRLAAISILGLTTIVAAGFAVIQYRRAEALTAELAAARLTEQEQTTVNARPLPSDSAASRFTEEAAARPALSEDFGDDEMSDETSEGPRPRNGGRRDFGARMDELLKDPEMAAAFQTQRRAALDRRYAELFSKLNLPPAQLNQLKDLLAEKQNAPRDVIQAARAEGLGRENRDEIRELIEITQAEIDADIRDAIGTQAFETLTNFEQTQPQRATVSQLESRLSYSGDPLNSAQAEAMVGILANTASSGATASFGPGRGGNNSTPITDAAIAQAQAVLSSDQLQALQTLQSEQQAAAALNQAMRAQFRPDRTPPSSGATPGNGGG
ncbi:hypothetical protein [Synoicihabitans lomoniglobus]|uniref:Uncharacterized protein n=1 Tax=Synoicihabitans lomoniglobus TaxID=2909285 RepID=A0AAF0CS54_9BACT|nr:hypothetical protein [Opitutaceae bacterium LMO-M01]WED67046.1 hypothetical protein PXH66_09305 [Opitutaceae bacterium LMO-M01]